MRILDINKIRLNTRIYDKNGVEAFDGDIIKDGYGNISEVYWHEQYQWSRRNYYKNEYGAKVFEGRLTSVKFIVPEEKHWEIIKRKRK